jgi:hypothetical protein
VEPLSIAALLLPVVPRYVVSTVASSSVVFAVASFAAALAAVLVSIAFSVATAAAEASLAIEVDLLLPDPPGAIDATTVGSG